MWKTLKKISLGWATLSVIVSCLVVEIVVACLLHASSRSVDTDTLPLLRLSGLAALGLATYWAFHAAFRHFAVRARKSWWDPGEEPDAESLTWDEVYELVAFGDAWDPIAPRTGIRWPWWRRTLWLQIPLYLIIWGVTLSALDLLRYPWPRKFMLDTNAARFPAPLATALGNPTAYLALIVGLATIFFTFRQIRAKVRADSRQQWIIRARELLGEVVALIDTHRDLRSAEKPEQAAKIWTKLNPLRLELELMLNPSEKDHRLLLYLIQSFAAWREPPQHSQDALIVIRSIAGPRDVPADSELPPLDAKWEPIIDRDDRSELVSYILRLSHVVLKREWERVKHTR